ncbi:WXG100 family type VII secretion target [Streptomyces sp. NPDC005279]|uniref:WXG100 family type VII secretion target n=1 Tax=Streptomyces sp. NPDC005279 TaxID=3364712 RepID=UPI00367E2B66
MADEPQTGRKAVPAPQETDFHSMSHEELLELIEGTNAETAAELARKLSSAATKITHIGDGLRTHMTRVVWKGEGGTAFENWGHQAAMATLELGKYSENASSWLQEVATAIAHAKSAVPKVDGSLETKAKESGDLAQLARRTGEPPSVASKYNKEHATALQEMERRRLEAAHELQKLGQTYTQSAQQIMSLQPPQFPPPPGEFVPPPTAKVYDTEYVGESGTRVGTGRSTADTHVSPPGHEDTTRPKVLAPADSGHTALPDRSVDMEIDGVATLPPPVSTPPPVTPGLAPPPSGHEGPGVPPIGMIPPAFGGSKTAMPSATAPGKLFPGARSTGVPGQAGINSRMPREGIVGGRPVPPNTGRPTGGIPRGTVIGNEGTTNARGPMGRGGTAGMHGGGPMGGASQSGISGGRRLASEAGGVVGGRPQQPGKNSARPFTPGGSGLVRGANSDGAAHPGQTSRAGAIPPGSHGANSRRDEWNGERPDYLSEDEETWQQGNRRVVPPVID